MKLLWLILFAKSAHFVSGQCTNRTYGPDCSKNCGFCKNSAPCDVVTGMCQGCSAGYEGILCLSGCSQGSYGEDCLLRCTQCVNNSCDPMNGACLNGTVQTTETTQSATVTSTVMSQPTTTTPQKGLVFDSPAVLFGLSVPMLVLIGAGALIFFIIIALICHTLLNRLCPRKKQVEPTYHATRRRSTRRNGLPSQPNE
ncbi:cell death abnormality protein 1-like isoform X2 [Saccostrea cucullata]|uniref:cell death abnormality protein 1-like isoform X2 n=1 Tax=Saccostrea cuccullata TaxID=36930 RepID=UPI002ED02D3C